MEEKKPKLKDAYIIEEKAGYITRESESGALLMDYSKGKIVEVNEVGLVIVKMCDGKNSIANIRNAVCEEYDVERDVLDRDIEEFFKKMEEFRVIDYV